MTAVCISRKVIEHSQDARSRDLEDVAVTVGAALLGGSVEIAVDAEHQPADGRAAVRAVEIVDNVEAPRRRDLKDNAEVAHAPEGSYAIEVAILTLGQCRRKLGTTPARSPAEFKQIAVGLGARGLRPERQTQH